MSYTKNPRFQQEWFDEIKELVDNYKPDLLYSDGAVPFGNEVGLSEIAHFYNLKARRGKTEAVYTCKQDSGGRLTLAVSLFLLAIFRMGASGAADNRDRSFDSGWRFLHASHPPNRPSPR